MSSIEGQYIAPLFVQEVPSGTVDGSNATFSTSHTPAANNAFVLLADGLALTQGTQYTITGSTITMTPAPAIGTKLYTTYLKG